MGLLDHDLAKAIYAGFKGKLLKGVLRKMVAPVSGGQDRYGDPIGAEPALLDIEGFDEAYSAMFRAQAGIPDSDVKVNIFAQSIPGVTPSKDDTVKLVRAGVATWYQIRRVDRDPATALWTCQSFEIPEPTP